MSSGDKESSKSKISKKLNKTDNKGKVPNIKNKMIINLIANENNDSNSVEKKFLSDNSLNNENIISKIIGNQKEKIKKTNKNNSSDKNNFLFEENKNNKEKEPKEKKDDNIIQINKENEKEIEEDKNEKENKIINKEIENDKENLKPDDIMLDIQNDKSNLEIIQDENIELENKLKDLLLEIKNEENSMIKTSNECQKELSNLDSDMKKQSEINKKVLSDISKLQKDLNSAYDKLVKYFSKNKNNFYNQNKMKIEKQLKVKESQCNYNQKVTLLLKKEISKYNKQLQSNTCIDQNIKKENPLINKKEEEYRYILNKLNEEIDKLKEEIQSLKKLKNKHLICNKTEIKLMDEIEFYKVEKQKKLDYMDSINKIKYIQDLRKKKVQIEREKINSLSSGNILSVVDNSKLENSLTKYEVENSKMVSIAPVKKVNLKKLKHPFTNSKSSNDINIFQKAKLCEQDKLAAEKLDNDKKNLFKEKYNESFFNSFGLFPNNLFTDEEKSIFKNYQFIPQEKVDIYEKKYTDMLEQLNKTGEKIRIFGKKKGMKIQNMKFKIIKNQKKQKDLERTTISNTLLIKHNESKIIKIKSLIKEKQKEEKKLELDLKKQNVQYKHLKKIIEMSKNFENLNSSESFKDFKELLVKAVDFENNKFFVTDLNNNIDDKKNNNNELNNKEEKEIKQEEQIKKEEENNKENIVSNNIKNDS